MVDFDIMFIALLYGLGGLEPWIRGRFGCVVLFKLFFYYVDNDGCMWWHKSAWLFVNVSFGWLHVYILNIIKKLGEVSLKLVLVWTQY